MGEPEFVYVTFIETTPEKLRQALASNDLSKLYFFWRRTAKRLENCFALGSR